MTQQATPTLVASQATIERIRQHPQIPTDCDIVFAHSQFGAHVGYVHCIDKSVVKSGKIEEVFFVALVLEAHHEGPPKRGHGGVSMSVLDEAMGRAASKVAGKLCYTVSMTTNFCAAANLDDLLVASARVKRAGRAIVFVDAELHANDRLIATATGTWANSGLTIPDMGNVICKK